jgi:glyoxylase-like metal-dependent hydrolase (beta-lactamase superfamily II)
VAVIDPGPDVESHIRALLSVLEEAEDVSILLTHGHSDHAGGASTLAELLGARILAPPDYSLPDHPSVTVGALHEGDRVETDQGRLDVLETPGHARKHLSFFWREADVLFVGDLLLGRGNTTWVGEYLGCVEDYLASLEKVEASGAGTLYPTHGPPITSPAQAVEKFRRHRLGRLEEVRRLKEARPDADPLEIAEAIYGGEIPRKLMKAAREGVEAALHHLDQPGNPG